MSRNCWVLLLALAVVACAPHQIYRDQITKVCVSQNPQRDCKTNALQQYRDRANPDSAYLLGFIEFDDQGQLWRREQMNAVITNLSQRAYEKDAIIVVFVHGWKHSAEFGPPEDSNIKTFRKSLKEISEVESAISKNGNKPNRDVIGVYLGWRGGSVDVPGLKELTFWDRKATAEKVGRVGVTEVLTRLELLQKTKDALVTKCLPDGRYKKSRTRLVVVGHSFGGAMVYSAVSQILQERFVDTVNFNICDERLRRETATSTTDARGFGNLVVLINPAFEANQFAPLGDMSNERRTYFDTQRPVLAVLTSEADYATKFAFPVGRSFSTVFETHRHVNRKDPVTKQNQTINQKSGNVTAIGHFPDYQTHTLSAVGEEPTSEIYGAARKISNFLRIRDEWNKDKPGNVIRFTGTSLKRSENSVARNPYLVIQVDKALIPDHNQIGNSRISAFLRELIFLTEQ